MEKVIDQLKNMLSTEEGQRGIKDVINNVGKDSGDEQQDRFSQRPFGPETFLKMKNIMEKMQPYDDPRMRLLSALRPYISKSRGNHIDNAVKILTLGKLPYLFRNINKDGGDL